MYLRTPEKGCDSTEARLAVVTGAGARLFLWSEKGRRRWVAFRYSVYSTSLHSGAATGLVVLVCGWALNSKSVPAWRRGSTSEVPLVTKSKVTFCI